MDGTLVGVTLLSMAMAISLSIVVWRLLRDERRRSSARVTALVDLAARGERSGSARVPVRRHTAAVPAPAARDLPLRAADVPVAVPDLFNVPKQPSPWPGRAGVIAGLILVTAAAVLFLLAQATAVESRAAAAPVPSLELLSLRDARQGDALTITGVVQNPRGASALSRVSATAATFDAAGALLASASAPLDFTTLQPGDESPFVVTVPVAGSVARYRISFRGADGAVIAHVDRRQPPMARGAW